MEAYLNACHILIKDFGQLVERTTVAVKAKAKALAETLGRPFCYVSSSQISKEGLVRQLAAKDRVTEGLIAILSALETCQAILVIGNRHTLYIEL